MWRDGICRQTICRTILSWEKNKNFSPNFTMRRLLKMTHESDDDALDFKIIVGHDPDRFHSVVRGAELSMISLGIILFDRGLPVDQGDHRLPGRGLRLFAHDQKVLSQGRSYRAPPRERRYETDPGHAR